MAEILSILEHQRLPIVDERRAGEAAISSRHAKILESIKSLPDNAYSWGNSYVKWSQYCGLIQLGELTLEVLPKVHGKEENAGACRQALVSMLRTAGLLKLHKLGGASIDLQRHTLLDIFILDFCSQLDDQLVQGKLRQYITFEENLRVLRGKLLAGHQLRHNLAHKERLYCQYDELSEDILINRVIKHALNFLLAKAKSQFVKRHIIRLLHEFDGVSDCVVDVQTIRAIKLNRAEKRFESILDMCLIFLQGVSPDVTGGKHQAFSLVFDMNQLFESWVARLFRPHARERGLRLLEQRPRRYFARRQDLDREVFQMKPDISFLEGERVVAIADVKWKLLDASEAKLGISQADLYQMQAYASRYGVDTLMLIYPRQQGLEYSYRLTLQGLKQVQLEVITMGVEKDRNTHIAKSLQPVFAVS